MWIKCQRECLTIISGLLILLLGLSSPSLAQEVAPAATPSVASDATPNVTGNIADTKLSVTGDVTSDTTQDPSQLLAQTDDQPSTNAKDPYEGFNRAMYHFNDILDHVILKPIATLYNKIVPKPLAKGISNFYSNIDTIPTVINDVLQANFYQATSDTWRLGINSTVGILGFFDVASNMGLEPNTEDFGLTLAQWGFTNSNYLVLPFFGPSTVRDAIGLPVDYYVFSIYPHINPTLTRYEIYGLGVVSRRANLLHYQNVIEQASVDKYVFLRDAYLQRRNYQIERNKQLGDPYLDKDTNANTNP